MVREDQTKETGVLGEGGYDPILLQILWNRLIKIADEGHAALVRTSFSTAVSESNDCAVVITDAEGSSLAQNAGAPPSFVHVLPSLVRYLLGKWPASRWRPGDVVVTNDPWLATGHLPDITMVAPIFFRDRLVAFATSSAHTSDIGGSMWAADVADAWEEGLRLLPVKLRRRGRLNRDLLDLVAANVRQPELVLGDMHAQLAALEVVRRGLVELLDDLPAHDLPALAGAMLERAERAMRRAIAAIPDGDYRHEAELDGFEEPIRLKLKLTVAGSAVHLDFAGSSPQIDKGVNSVLNFTYAYAAYPLKCALDPATPQNEGAFRPITVAAPSGSILNPLFPAPVGARHLTGQVVSTLVLAALSAAIPDLAMAESGATPALRAVLSGTRRDDRRFVTVLFASGGVGATAGHDGLHCTPFPTNTGCASLEVLESLAPLRFHRRELLTDSGGAGERRGGCGQEIVVELTAPQPARLSTLAERLRNAAQGILGGGPGSPAALVLNGERPVPGKARSSLAPGDALTIRYAGGGGYGDPRRRDRALVAADLQNGLVSPESARREYGYEPESTEERR
ncbi:MAG: hydantoinase B/oxoprolinase family protein [Chloroflexi bacterium]|nr:hydantoinase B/oxoprolinase family protein [Chloroflexota bacterium]